HAGKPNQAIDPKDRTKPTCSLTRHGHPPRPPALTARFRPGRPGTGQRLGPGTGPPRGNCRQPKVLSGVWASVLVGGELRKYLAAAAEPQDEVHEDGDDGDPVEYERHRRGDEDDR